MAEIKKVYKNWTEYDVLNSDTVGSALTAGTGIGISSNTISNTWVTSVNGQTWDVTVASGITKIFTLSSTSDLTNAQAAYDWANSGNVSIIKYGVYTYQMITPKSYYYVDSWITASTTQDYYMFKHEHISFGVTSWNVTAIYIPNMFYIKQSDTAPTSWTPNSTITLVI